MAEALAFDLGEWFHDAALREHVSPRHWRRLASGGDEAFAAARASMTGRAGTATWFVTGELATRHAAALRELVLAGHEIGLAAAPLALAYDASAAERERAQQAWTRALAAVEAATGVAACGVLLPWPCPAQGWCHAWFAAARLGYVVAPAGTGAAWAVTALDGGAAVAVHVVPAWAAAAARPRLVGLPAAVFAAHYGREVPPLPAAATTGLAAATARPAVAPAPRALEVLAQVPTNAAATTRLAVVVPLKDEEAGIASLAVELAAVARALADVAACEFVFVDDGSSDRTWALLQEHFGGWPGVRLVQHDHNRGVAAAIRTGLNATDAPFAASIDGDLSYDPMELRAMLPLAFAGADVVTASPYHPRGGVKNVPGWRLALSRTLSFAYRVLLRAPVRTWTSCFRVYRRAAVADLPLANPGFLGTAELLVRVLRRGGRVVEHPCVLEARLFGFSKMKVLRTILGHLRLLAAVACGRVR